MRLRTLLVLLTTAVTATAAHAQGPVAPTPAAALPFGVRLRIETTDRSTPVFGTLVALDGGALVLQNDDGPHAGEPAGLVDQVRVPVALVRHAYVRSGHEPRTRAAARGAAYGAVLGAVLAVAQNAFFGAVEQPDDRVLARAPSSGELWSLRNPHMRFDLAMIPVGALVGALRARPRWSEIPLVGR